MKKFLCVFLAALMLCPAVFAKDYVQMTAPDGTEVSVYKYSVNDYKALGYELSGKEIWKPVNAEIYDGRYKEYGYGAITNGEKCYYLIDVYSTYLNVTYLCEKDMQTGDVKNIAQTYLNRIITVFDDKIYLQDSWSSDVPTVYSYNLVTGEAKEEYIGLRGKLNTTQSYNFGETIVFLNYEYYEKTGRLYKYNFLTDELTLLDDSVSLFGEHFATDVSVFAPLYINGSDIYYISGSKTKTAKCVNVNTGEKRTLCTIGNVEMWEFVDITYDYFVYTNNGNAYIRYFSESAPRWLMSGGESDYIYFIIDEYCTPYVCNYVAGRFNVYSYKNGVLEYYTYSDGNAMSQGQDILTPPSEITNGVITGYDYIP